MNRLRPSCLFAYAACVLVVTPASARASDALRIAAAQVTITCPLTIGGSFEAKTTQRDSMDQTDQRRCDTVSR